MIARAEFDDSEAERLAAALKREAAKQNREHDRSQGSLERVMEEVQRSFGVGTLEEARELLERMEREWEEEGDSIREMVRKYEKRVGRKLL